MLAWHCLFSGLRKTWCAWSQAAPFPETLSGQPSELPQEDNPAPSTLNIWVYLSSQDTPADPFGSPADDRSPSSWSLLPTRTKNLICWGRTRNKFILHADWERKGREEKMRLELKSSSRPLSSYLCHKSAAILSHGHILTAVDASSSNSLTSSSSPPWTLSPQYLCSVSIIFYTTVP